MYSYIDMYTYIDIIHSYHACIKKVYTDIGGLYIMHIVTSIINMAYQA